MEELLLLLGTVVTMSCKSVCGSAAFLSCHTRPKFQMLDTLSVSEVAVHFHNLPAELPTNMQDNIKV
jgi:hypothetical protein